MEERCKDSARNFFACASRIIVRARNGRASRGGLVPIKPSVTLLGTGGPRPDVQRGGTGLLIRYDDDLILIDAGRGVVRQLAQLEVPFSKINSLLVTHHHYDHIGELHDVILTSWLQGRKAPLNIYGPPETRRIVDALLTQVYDKDIEWRVTGEPANGVFPPVPVTEVISGLVYQTDRYRIFSEVVDHGLGLSLSDGLRRRWICLGFRFECDEGVIAFSGDTVDCEGLQRLAVGADILVQCCYLARSELAEERWRQVAKYTLTSADTAGGIAKRAGVKTMVLTHHRQKSPELLEEMRADIQRECQARVVIGYDGLTVSID
jgi:ribonuclease Z